MAYITHSDTRWESIFRGLVSEVLTATGDGAPAGATIVCSHLTGLPDFNGGMVVIASGPYRGQARDINGTTILGTVTPHTAFGGLITTGTNFIITTIRTTPAEVAAIEGKLDDGTAGLAALKALIDEKPEWGTPPTGTHTTASENKETILELTLTDPYRLWMYIDLRAMQAGDTFQFTVEIKVNGTNYCVKDQQTLTDAQTVEVFEINGLYGDTACDIKVSVKRTGGADRAFPFRYNVLKEA